MQNILNFTNTDSEEFVGMYHGEEYIVKEGETKPLVESAARHLADALATKILIRKKVRNYLNDAQREPLIKEMLGELVIPKKEEVVDKILGDKEPVEEEKEFEELKKVKKPKKKVKN